VRVRLRLRLRLRVTLRDLVELLVTKKTGEG
jgi:hypothetical protein